MIYKNGKEVTSIFKENRPIAIVYKGSRLVWEAINSCFGKGFWVNVKPWNNNEGWKNK
ncbi:MFS transporter [Candidatus Bacteroides intestinigallinarum]|jgi:hypothetical protein|uniref:MFS transporter n=1 Tax=Bacteroides TaxID=816 RepID=UPI000E962A4E|nr:MULTISPECIES: MFS transporter [Bacteroides]MCS3176964.1 MFS transporter [Candidatus Bacteroides intestinigallinarum]RGN62166.1 MFS transporter [Bacteroides sp. OM05-10AA]RGQ66490.1 MFS transporter [Bacteroides sp. AF27-33]DAJ40773.1 MAG TPA: hypothetical protein [Caudoviricetes sp.]